MPHFVQPISSIICMENQFAIMGVLLASGKQRTRLYLIKWNEMERKVGGTRNRITDFWTSARTALTAGDSYCTTLCRRCTQEFRLVRVYFLLARTGTTAWWNCGFRTITGQDKYNWYRNIKMVVVPLCVIDAVNILQEVFCLFSLQYILHQLLFIDRLYPPHEKLKQAAFFESVSPHECNLLWFRY